MEPTITVEKISPMPHPCTDAALPSSRRFAIDPTRTLSDQSEEGIALVRVLITILLAVVWPLQTLMAMAMTISLSQRCVKIYSILAQKG